MDRNFDFNKRFTKAILNCQVAYKSTAMLYLTLILATTLSVTMALPEKAPAPALHHAPLHVPAPPPPPVQLQAQQTDVSKNDETFFERCPQGTDWVKFRGNCYRHFPNPKYWYTAKQECETLYRGHLVSVADAAENAFVGKLTYCKPTWLGRFAVDATRLTNPGSYRWTDGTQSQYHAHNFSATGLLHFPLVSAANLQWENDVYHGQHNYVCKVPAPQRNYTCDCPTGWKQLDGHCYLMPQFDATYIEADFYCRGRGAYVTSVHTETELRAMSLIDVDSQSCPVDTWIGLLKLNPCRIDFSTGSQICYRWSDRSGDYKQFPRWQAGNPVPDQVTNCVMLKDKEIKTVPCYTRARFVCKKKVESVVKL